MHLLLITAHCRYDDPESPYSVGCVLEFESLEVFKKAAGAPEAAEIFGDIVNFSDEKPVIITGEVKATS
jgi:uncharacterized protein (TIGR02118 family)